MRINPKLRRWLRLQGYLSVVLIVAITGLLAYLSTRYEKSYDWTAAQRHTLSATSREVLAKMRGPVSITAFARESTPEDKSLREWITRFVKRYQAAKHDITLEFVDPDKSPDRVREAGVRLNGELVVRFNNRDLHVDNLTEQNLTNALQNLARNAERWIVFLKGHGERDPQGKANSDLGLFGEQLGNRGFKVQSLELAQSGAIPDNTSVLVLTTPQVDPLPAARARAAAATTGRLAETRHHRRPHHATPRHRAPSDGAGRLLSNAPGHRGVQSAHGIPLRRRARGQGACGLGKCAAPDHLKGGLE